MKTNDFITALRNSPAKKLIFASESRETVPPGYHLTEIKAAKFDTVDCGGQVNHWPETILQLWVPADAGDKYMSTNKFLSIFDKVRRLIPLDQEAEVRIEYGDENFFPSTYHIDSISRDNDTLAVLLKPPATTCKARDRAACCDSACCAA